jgi:hypothetical protein
MGCSMTKTKKTREEFAASILDDDTERKMFKGFLGGRNEAIAWKAFKLIVAYKRGDRRQREHFSAILSDEKESEMLKRFLKSKNKGIAREAVRLAERYGP